MHGLTPRQQEILSFISRRIEEQGYPPTIREIGEEMGIRSTNGVNDHLKALERKGYLRREGLKSRALRPVSIPSLDDLHEEAARRRDPTPKIGGFEARIDADPDIEPIMAPRQDAREAGAAGPERIDSNSADAGRSRPSSSGPGANVVSALIPSHTESVAIRVLGRVAAGSPILADEHAEATVHVDRFFVGSAPSDQLYALRVSGDSMIDAGIFDGDYIFVRKQLEAHRGDIVVAMIDGEATVKRYEPDGDVIRFIPENASMDPIVVRRSDFRSTSLLGVVVGVYRKFSP
ncbi:MAG: transcriptional repressor LexA [Myxococcota bacterium]